MVRTYYTRQKIAKAMKLSWIRRKGGQQAAPASNGHGKGNSTRLALAIRKIEANIRDLHQQRVTLEQAQSLVQTLVP